MHQLSYIGNETVRAGSEQNFFLSKITGPRWLELPIARTNFDSPFKFEPAKFYCTLKAQVQKVLFKAGIYTTIQRKLSGTFQTNILIEISDIV